MDQKTDGPHRGSETVGAALAVLATLAPVDRQYLYGVLLRTLPEEVEEMGLRLAVDSVWQYLCTGRGQTKDGYIAWALEEETAGRVHPNGYRIAQDHGWQTVVLLASKRPRPDGHAITIKRTRNGRPPTKAEAAEALDLWVKARPNGSRARHAFEVWVTAENRDRQERGEDLLPRSVAAIVAVLEAQDLFHALEPLDPDARARHKSGRVQRQGFIPNWRLVEDLQRCFDFYKRPFTSLEYKSWAESRVEDGDKPAVSAITFTRRGGWRAVVRRLDMHHVIAISVPKGPKSMPEADLAEFLGRAIARAVRMTGRARVTCPIWEAERTAGGGPVRNVLLGRGIGGVREAPLALLQRHQEFLPEGVTLTQMEEDAG